jgi:hypothetical protein
MESYDMEFTEEKNTSEQNPNKSNPYIDNAGQARILRSVVCYADLLGYSRMIKYAMQNGTLRELMIRVLNAVGAAYSHIRRGVISITNGKDLFKVKAFSDNIVIGYPMHDDGEAELGHVFEIFHWVQWELLEHGFLVRGAVACGEHYMDEDIAFGPALVEAVKCDFSGDGPRIILAPSASAYVRKHLGYYVFKESAPQTHDLLQDADGQWFLNYLDIAFIAHPDDRVFTEVIKKHKEVIETGLEQYRGDYKIWSKYQWAAQYHNFVCRAFADSELYRGCLEECLYFDAEQRKQVKELTISQDTLMRSPTRLLVQPEIR